MQRQMFILKSRNVPVDTCIYAHVYNLSRLITHLKIQHVHIQCETHLKLKRSRNIYILLLRYNDLLLDLYMLGLPQRLYENKYMWLNLSVINNHRWCDWMLCSWGK